MEITQFQISDRPAVRRLHRDIYEPLKLDSYKWHPCQQVESLERDGVKYAGRNGGFVGYVAAYQLDETHSRLNLLVDPQQTRRGIGTRLLDKAEADLREASSRYLQARLLESMPASLLFALARGFQEVHRMRGMTLIARNFTGLAKWDRLGQRLRAQGFVVTNLQTELEEEENGLEKLATLHMCAQHGWPSPDPTQQHEHSLEQAKAIFNQVVKLARFSIMKLGAEYVGYTSARNAMIPTAVHPNYRGLGIATYLKAYDLQQCAVDGQTYFESATANPAMQRVNEKLGYQFNGLVEVRLVKHL